MQMMAVWIGAQLYTESRGQRPLAERLSLQFLGTQEFLVGAGVSANLQFSIVQLFKVDTGQEKMNISVFSLFIIIRVKSLFCIKVIKECAGKK
jgi:hypothetical protein